MKTETTLKRDRLSNFRSPHTFCDWNLSMHMLYFLFSFSNNPIFHIITDLTFAYSFYVCLDHLDYCVTRIFWLCLLRTVISTQIQVSVLDECPTVGMVYAWNLEYGYIVWNLDTYTYTETTIFISICQNLVYYLNLLLLLWNLKETNPKKASISARFTSKYMVKDKNNNVTMSDSTTWPYMCFMSVLMLFHVEHLRVSG